MNTATVLKEHRPQAEAHLSRLMFEDGFGFDEALANAPTYARLLFKSTTPTGVLRVKQILTSMEQGAIQ